MPVDIRATVFCSLGPLISATISDDYCLGVGLIKTKGSCEINQVITPQVGTAVTFSYTPAQGGSLRTVPRKLRVLSSFSDPIRRTTKVELGCRLTMLEDFTESEEWRADDDPLTADVIQNVTRSDGSLLITMPLEASSIGGLCLTKLGLTLDSDKYPDGLPLTNQFSVEKFDYSSGYVQVLSDLLVSEGYLGHLDTNETLQLIYMPNAGLRGPGLSSNVIVDISPLGIGERPADAVFVSYTTLKLKNSSEEGTDVTDEILGDGNWLGSGIEFPPFSNTNSATRGTVVIPYGEDQTKTYNTLTTTEEEVKFKEINGRSVIEWRITTDTQSDVLVAGSLVSQYLSAGLAWGTSNVKTVTKETFTYDSQGNVTQRILESRGDALIAVGSTGLSLMFADGDGNPDPVPIPDGRVLLRKEVEDIFTVGDYQKRIVQRYGNWAQSIQGQQAIAEGRDIFTTAAAVSSFLGQALSGEYLIDVQIDVQKVAAGAQQSASSATIANAQQADPEVANPADDFRAEGVQELELAIAETTAPLRTITLNMPYAPDDAFKATLDEEGNPTFTSLASNAPAKARRFGRIQNDIRMGMRYGMNVQTPAWVLGDAVPFSSVTVALFGFAAMYRMNGTTFTMDSSGIICSSDMLFRGSVGGGASDSWVPMPPDVVLPDPPEVGDEGEIVEPDYVLPPFAETVVVPAVLRAKVFALRLDYALSLETIADPYGVTVGMTAAKVLPVVTIGLTAAAPTVLTGASVAAPAAATALTGAAPAVAGGASVAAPAADVALAAISDIVAGRPRTQIAVPVGTIAAAAGTPTVSIGAAVSAPANGIILLGAAPRFLDAATRTYVQAVEAADGQRLERGVVLAYDDFVLGCKSDGIWNAIKASCIMAGARTLAGALTPLVGTAPTNYNFVAGDYNRTTGLTGNTTNSAYLDTNRAGNADPQNNAHMALYQATGTYSIVFGNRSGVPGPSYVDTEGVGLRARSRTTLGDDDKSATPTTGIVAYSRTGSTSGTIRGYGTNYSITTTSQTPQAETPFLFARRNNSTGLPEFYTTGTVCFYSIGESLNLALLDSRVSRLVNEIAFYLNTGLSGTNYDIDTLKYINAGYAAGGTLS